MNDFLIQSKPTGFVGIAGPAFVKTQTGEEISLDKLSGWEAHAVKSGYTHIVGEDDAHSIELAKQLLSCLPSNNREKPPTIESGDDPDREIPELDHFLPDIALRVPYSMYPLIDMVVDKGIFFEAHKHFTPNVIVGFARFNGRVAGIVSNNTLRKMGALDCDASDKLTQFVRFCELFNVPLVTLVDYPGVPDRLWAGVEGNSTSWREDALCVGQGHRSTCLRDYRQIICWCSLSHAR